MKRIKNTMVTKAESDPRVGGLRCTDTGEELLSALPPTRRPDLLHREPWPWRSRREEEERSRGGAEEEEQWWNGGAEEEKRRRGAEEVKRNRGGHGEQRPLAFQAGLTILSDSKCVRLQTVSSDTCPYGAGRGQEG